MTAIICHIPESFLLPARRGMASPNSEFPRTGQRLLRYALPLICLIIGLGFSFQYWRTRSNSIPRIKAIVVLPLHNVSGDPSQQYFADGMTEQLISDLGQISALRVISRTSSMSLRNGDTIPQIRASLASMR